MFELVYNFTYPHPNLTWALWTKCENRHIHFVIFHISDKPHEHPNVTNRND